MPLDVKRIWDACGAAFDRFTTAEDSFSENIERPAIASLASDLGGKRLLDMGCGSGTYSLWFAGRGAQVTGMDLSPVMVSMAQEKARAEGLDIRLLAGDLNRPLPFEDGEFDIVFTATVLHYVEDLSSVMKETARVMSHGGALIASALHPMSTALFSPADREKAPRYFGSPERMIETPWLDFGEVSDEGRRIISYHHTVEDYFRALRSARLNVTDLLEPAPPPQFASKNAARYEEAMRVPVYLIFRAEHSR
ncbi:MAG TPA: methyltransferase domain-containing protein [Blastocatellia bacterium]|nr:methyltransferase domain-containing protein [Blastocatellia bacterium]